MIYLSENSLEGYLQSVDVIPVDERVTVTVIDGGVSNVVLAAKGTDTAMIVKQALPRLKVADEWLAPIERTVNEGQALQLFGSITPGAVPKVLYLDVENCILTIEHAPMDWHDWKIDLLAGKADSQVSKRRGDLLATWQQRTPSPAATSGTTKDSWLSASTPAT